MESCLTPFVENMNQLSTVALSAILIIPSFILKFSRWLVALILRQFNGRDGCGQCLHPEEWVRNSNKPRCGGFMKYPLLKNVPKIRKMADNVQHAAEATANNPVSGVMSRSPSLDLLKFELIHGCVPESMHACSEVAKQFVKLLFRTKEKVGLMSRQLIGDIDKLLTNIKCPNQVGRLFRHFSEREFWKAREWENWTLYYSIPILLHILPLEYIQGV